MQHSTGSSIMSGTTSRPGKVPHGVGCFSRVIPVPEAPRRLFARKPAAIVKGVLGVAALGLFLSACSQEEVLEGPRYDTRTPIEDVLTGKAKPVTDREEIVARPVPLVLPKPVRVTAWTHPGANPRHLAPHAALAGDLQPLWASEIGRGNDRRHRMSADPVGANGRVYTLDVGDTVSALDAASGKILWQHKVVPLTERGDEAAGGGLALADGRLFVSTGFAELQALDAASGKVLWKQKLDAVPTGAAMVRGGRVHVVTRGGKAYALDVKTGRIAWQQESTDAPAYVAGGASPADGGRVVILPFGSGEVMAVLPKTGIRLWSSVVAGGRKTEARSEIPDIAADPVVVRGKVHVANQAGRMVTLVLEDGKPLWTAPEGTLSQILPAGSAIFLVSDENELVRLSAQDGELVWKVPLPGRSEKSRWRRRNTAVNYGPILAGGRLIVASSDGKIRLFDPVSGALEGTREIPGGAASRPIVLDGTLFVLSRKGRLHAWR